MLHGGDQTYVIKGTKKTPRPSSLVFFIYSKNLKITGPLKKSILCYEIPSLLMKLP